MLTTKDFRMLLSVTDVSRHASLRRTRRNALQQLKRATPEAKAYEARASRRSYWRKADQYGKHDADCSYCKMLKNRHDL